MNSDALGLGVAWHGWHVQNPGLPLRNTLVAWYDAMDADTLTVVGSKVTQWDDKSGGGWHVSQGAGADQPSVSTLNGRAALLFAGGQHLDGVIWSQQSPTTIFVVYQFTSPLDGGSNRLFSSDTDDRIRYQKRGSGGSHRRRMHENTNLNGSVEDTNAHYHTGIYDGGNSVLRIDGAVDATGSVGTKTPSSDGLSIGAEKNGTNDFNGTLGELLWYDRRLTDAEILTMERYLKLKWGL